MSTENKTSEELEEPSPELEEEVGESNTERDAQRLIDFEDIIDSSYEPEDYSQIGDLYKAADSPDTIDDIIHGYGRLTPTEEEVQGIAIFDDDETIIIGERTWEDLEEELEKEEDEVSDTPQEVETEKTGSSSRFSKYKEMLKPEDGWDYTMYGGALTGLTGLAIGSAPLLGAGIATEVVGAAGKLLKNHYTEPDVSVEQEEVSDEQDYELGDLADIAEEDYQIKIFNKDNYNELIEDASSSE